MLRELQHKKSPQTLSGKRYRPSIRTPNAARERRTTNRGWESVMSLHRLRRSVIDTGDCAIGLGAAARASARFGERPLALWSLMRVDAEPTFAACQASVRRATQRGCPMAWSRCDELDIHGSSAPEWVASTPRAACSARGCYLCLRYVPAPMCSVRTAVGEWRIRDSNPGHKDYDSSALTS